MRIRRGESAVLRGRRLKRAGLAAAIGVAISGQPALAAETSDTPESKGGTAVLAPIQVQAKTENEGPLGPLIQQDTSTATKTDTPILDTARSVSVETRQQIVDKGFQRLEDAYMYTAGVHGGTAGFDSRGDWGSLRGFDMPVAYVDGLQYGNDGYYNFSLPAIEMLERVEILKGPASALYGMSSVGGIVNAVSKRPQEEAMRRVTVEYGTFDRKQATLDMTGKLDENGKILGRVVALVRDAETQVNYSKNDAILFAPSITLRPDTDTDVTILARYQKTDNTPDIQFLSQAGTLDPAPNGRKLPTSTFIGEPDLNRMYSVDESVTLDAKHRIDDVWSVQGIVRYSHSAAHLDQAYWTYYTLDPDRYEAPDEINRDFYKQNGATYMWVGDLNTTAKFTTGPVDHQVLMGVGYSNVKFDNDYNQCSPFVCYPGTGMTIDPFNPTFTGVPDFDVVDFPTNTFKQTGAYLQDQATILERIILTGGLRWDKFDATDPYGGDSNDDHDITYNASLLYKFDAGFSPYISYAESFLQESYGATFAGETFKPTHGKQYEVGLKYQPPGTSSLFTVALFDITKSNILIADVPNPGFFIQGGEAKSKGIELEAQTVIRDFYLEGNYTYLDTEDEYGAPIDYTARHQASGWVTWRPQGVLLGFKAGGGIRYIGRTVYGGTYVPSNTLGDAMIGYETADWDLTLNARNVTDRIYVATAGYGGGFYGQRRTVALTLGYNF